MFDEARSVCSVLRGFKICALGRSIASTISSNLLRCNWESAVSTHSASASDLVLEFDLTRHGSGKVADAERRHERISLAALIAFERRGNRSSTPVG